MKYYSSNETSPFWMPPSLSSRASSKTSCVCRNAGFLGLFDASLIGLVASFPIHCAVIIQYCKYKIFELLNAMDDKLKRSGGSLSLCNWSSSRTEAQVELGTGNGGGLRMDFCPSITATNRSYVRRYEHTTRCVWCQLRLNRPAMLCVRFVRVEIF